MRKFIYMGILFLLIAMVFIGISTYKQNDRNEIIKITQQWSKMNEFPSDSSITLIEKLGSATSREFRIKFTASPESTRKWLSESHGTAEVAPMISDGIEIYKIIPSEKAQFAEVIYNTKINEVYIRVYWS